MIVKGKPPPVGGLPLVITRDSALARNPMMAIFCSDLMPCSIPTNRIQKACLVSEIIF